MLFAPSVTTEFSPGVVQFSRKGPFSLLLNEQTPGSGCPESQTLHSLRHPYLLSLPHLLSPRQGSLSQFLRRLQFLPLQVQGGQVTNPTRREWGEDLTAVKQSFEQFSFNFSSALPLNCACNFCLSGVWPGKWNCPYCLVLTLVLTSLSHLLLFLYGVLWLQTSPCFI